SRHRESAYGSFPRTLVASARGGARMPRPIEQVSLQWPVAATRGGIVKARLTFPTRPAKSRLDEVERLVLGIGGQGRNRTTDTGIFSPDGGVALARPHMWSLAAARAISGASRSSGQTGLALQLLQPRIG